MKHDRSHRHRWLRTVLDRYEGALVRYATRLLGDVERGRDVVQDAFIRLCNQDPQEVDGHVAQWLYTVCRRRALDVRRKENRMESLSEVVMDSRPCPSPTPDVVAEDRQTVGRLSELLTQLPENQQEVVRLKFQEGLRYKEIAAVTGLSVGNVGFLLHAAIATIRQRMNVEHR